MQWTKRHSRNAVAAKARLRQARAQAEYPSDRIKCAVPRPMKADFIIRIEDRFGERLQVSVFRCMGRVHVSGGGSVRQLCRGLEQLFTKSA